MDLQAALKGLRCSQAVSTASTEASTVNAELSSNIASAAGLRGDTLRV
jgi:hypothetical protein